MGQKISIALIGLNLISLPAFSKMKEPSYPLSRRAMVELMGSADAARIRGNFTCDNLLAKTWPYPASNAVLSLCWNAEQSCYAYIILRDQLQTKSNKSSLDETSLTSSHEDAQFRLSSCLTAIDNAIQGNTEALPPLGQYSAPIPLVPAPRSPVSTPSLPLSSPSLPLSR